MKTGFNKLDKILGEIKGGQVMVVANRPIVNHRTFLLQVLLNSTDIQQLHSAYYSVECSNMWLLHELIRIKAGLKSFGLSKKYNTEDYAKIGEATHKVYKLVYETYKLELFDEINTTISDIAENIELCSKGSFFENPYDLVMIDYLQYLDDKNNKEYKEYNKKNEGLLQHLKQIATQFNIPIIVSTGVCKKVENKQDLKIDLQDITINNVTKYADKIIAIDEDIKGKSTINVLHNKNGNTGCVNLQFTKSLYK